MINRIAFLGVVRINKKSRVTWFNMLASVVFYLALSGICQVLMLYICMHHSQRLPYQCPADVICCPSEAVYVMNSKYIPHWSEKPLNQASTAVVSSGSQRSAVFLSQLFLSLTLSSLFCERRFLAGRCCHRDTAIETRVTTRGPIYLIVCRHLWAVCL